MWRASASKPPPPKAWAIPAVRKGWRRRPWPPCASVRRHKVKLPRASAVVSTVFGIGYFPQAQGTIMSAIAVPLAILIAIFGGGGMGLLGSAIIVLVIGILASADYVRESG